MLSRMNLRLARWSSQQGGNSLRTKLETLIPQKKEQLARIKKDHGTKELGKCTVGAAIGGMRGLKAMLYETSSLDPQEGITYNGGYSIPDICARGPKAVKDGEPLPEAVFWLLLTGSFPTETELKSLQAELRQKGELPRETLELLKSLPKDTHPMTQLSMGILSLQRNSKFAEAYRKGVAKTEYWKYYLEDSIDLIAKLPHLAARIYRHTYFNDKYIESDANLDWAGNYAHMLGYEQQQVKEVIRGYLSIHADHEGGNVSAHTSHLVGSALSDAYLSYSAAINGLAGPLHGLANQEVLRWLMGVREQVGDNPTDAQLEKFAWDTLNSGKVIPGYGHGVLRNTDPRYTHQAAFAKKHIKNDALVNLTAQLLKIVPDVLKKQGKVANPFPNVDAHSGVLLYHYGFTQFDYYTVVFGVSRALGCCASLIWSRALGLPIERPGSITMDAIESRFK
jgi:citrate synthase